MNDKTDAKELLEFISVGTSPYSVVQECIRQLSEAGFKELKMRDSWNIEQGEKYYINYHGSTLFAFAVGKEWGYQEGFRIAAAHTDVPCFCIKAKPDLTTEQYAQLNIEVYGGPILNTWLDRPLSVSGRVTLKSNSIFKPEVRIIDIRKPILTIPNLAIHMNKEVNKGVELNRQTDLLPILAMVKEELGMKDYFINFLANHLEIEKEKILEYELYLYNAEEGQLVGIEEEFISAPRIDNLSSVLPILKGIMNGERKKGINVCALFDHEEIGSKTKQGAASMILSMVLEKILLSAGRDRATAISLLTESSMLSIDVAHALHPNKIVKSDITNKTVLNKGVCIKEAHAQSYATDSEIIGAIEQLFQHSKIPYQKFVNRSDLAGGNTLGAIASTMLPMNVIDIGAPILAMHSARELMGVNDQAGLCKIVLEYFQYEE